MKHLFYFILLLFIFTISTSGQSDNDDAISDKDSILLTQFWKGFRKAVDEQNKTALSKYFSFPFYCSPCLDYSPVKDSIDPANPPATVKVTRKVFEASAYQLFFEIPGRNRLTKQLWKQVFVFMPTINDKNKKDGYQFSFALVPPSKKWEGSQAFVYLKKRHRRFVIAGVDSVP